MVKGKRKPLDEIKDTIASYNSVMIVGCGGCVSICLAGGLPEVKQLWSDLKSGSKLGEGQRKIDGFVVERQCNATFLMDLDDKVGDFDCLLSMACGAGVQYLAERFPHIPCFPAINTMGIGIDVQDNVGVYEERCRACGTCVLAYTGGICPVVNCAKSLFNGPCGGTLGKGGCELGNDTPCAWFEIYERLSKQNRVDDIIKIQPTMAWENQKRRTIIIER